MSLKFHDLGLALGLFWTPHAALAQAANVPTNVNECTLIQDPIELRNCILRFEGNRVPPPNVVESYGAKPSADQMEPTDPGVTRNNPGKRALNREKRQAGPSHDASALRPTANDTLISIEQIRVPPKSSH